MTQEELTRLSEIKEEIEAFFDEHIDDPMEVWADGLLPLFDEQDRIIQKYLASLRSDTDDPSNII